MEIFETVLYVIGFLVGGFLTLWYLFTWMGDQEKEEEIRWQQRKADNHLKYKQWLNTLEKTRIKMLFDTEYKDRPGYFQYVKDEVFDAFVYKDYYIVDTGHQTIHFKKDEVEVLKKSKATRSKPEGPPNKRFTDFEVE